MALNLILIRSGTVQKLNSRVLAAVVLILHLIILTVHLIVTVLRLLSPGGYPAVIAESVVAKHQSVLVDPAS